jgi:hypothetical protein
MAPRGGGGGGPRARRGGGGGGGGPPAPLRCFFLAARCPLNLALQENDHEYRVDVASVIADQA